MMKKTGIILVSLLCVTALFAADKVMQVNAESPEPVAAESPEPAAALESFQIYGTVNDNTSKQITMLRQDGDANGQDLILNLSNETKVLDAVTGFPIDVNDIKNGDTIYAYIGPVMTMSLPPITNPLIVLANIPADFKVPEFVKSSSLSVNKDGVSGTMTGTNGTTYTIPADCRITPYLTRNIVTIQDLTEGRTCLIWTNADSDTASEILVFAPEPVPAE